MRYKSCKWRPLWGTKRKQRGRSRLKAEHLSGTETYWNHVANAASFAAYKRNENNDACISVEAIPENSNLLDFRSFAQNYPEKLFPRLETLRPEFQEIFIEYWILGKFQNFIGKVHGQVHTRIWQQLRIIEQALGALIVLGTNPTEEILRPILEKAGLEKTPYGSLTQMILLYAQSQNYALVAKAVGAPVPAIRKIFRPAIATLVISKDIKAASVGAYLRNLTHHASLTKAGLSKRCIARTQRIKTMRFQAEPIEDSPLLSFGKVDSLHDTPWNMFELSPECQMTQLYPLIQKQGKHLFRKKAVQVFAPVNAEGELAFGYIFARSATRKLVRALLHIRGIAEMATVSTNDETTIEAVTIPNEDVQAMMMQHNPPKKLEIHTGDFVEILTGETARYCGIITSMKKNQLTVEVNFPTGRQFIVTAAPTCVKLLPKVSADKQAFWGVRN